MNNNPKEQQKPERGMLRWNDLGILSDVFGSYTGVPLDGDVRPVQDADDL